MMMPKQVRPSDSLNYGIAFCCDFMNSDNTRQMMAPTKQIENALLKPDRV
jgi:hypothetical protein